MYHMRRLCMCRYERVYLIYLACVYDLYVHTHVYVPAYVRMHM